MLGFINGNTAVIKSTDQGEFPQTQIIEKNLDDWYDYRNKVWIARGQGSLVVTSEGSAMRMPSFKTQFHHLSPYKYKEVIWLLCAFFGFLFCTVGMIIVPISQGCYKDWITYYVVIP